MTSVEREAYDLRHSTEPPMRWAVMARKLKKDARSVRRACERAEIKIPLEGKIAPPRDGTLEANDPERYAEFVTEVVGTGGRLKDVSVTAERLGIPYTTAKSIAERLNTSQIAVRDEIRTVKRDYLKRRWGVVAKDALDAITQEKLDAASVRDLGILGGIATDKLLVLQGLPTQIVRTEEDRAKLGDLAEALMLEEWGGVAFR